MAFGGGGGYANAGPSLEEIVSTMRSQYNSLVEAKDEGLLTSKQELFLQDLEQALDDYYYSNSTSKLFAIAQAPLEEGKVISIKPTGFGEVLSSSPQDENASIVEQEQKEGAWWDTALEATSIVLTILGFVPGFGAVADALAVVVDLIRGDYVSVALSAASMIPIAGVAAGISKLGKFFNLGSDIAKAGSAVADTAKAADNVTDMAKAADNVADVAKVSDNATDVAKQIDASSLVYSKKAKHSDRPYQQYTQQIQNIIESTPPKADPRGTEGLWWDVEGAFNKSEGHYELLISPDKTTIWHYMFESSKR